MPRATFLKLLQSYKDKQNLTIEADSNALRIGSTTLGHLGYTPAAVPPDRFDVFPVTDTWIATQAKASAEVGLPSPLPPKSAVPPPALVPPSAKPTPMQKTEAMIPFDCPQCGQKLEAEKGMEGQQVQCPTCSKSLTVPTLDIAMPNPPSVEAVAATLARVHGHGVAVGGPAQKQAPVPSVTPAAPIEKATTKDTAQEALQNVKQPFFRNRRSEMNLAQKIVAFIGIVFFTLIGLFPPWTATFNFQGANQVSARSEWPAGSYFLLAPPRPQILPGYERESLVAWGSGVKLDGSSLAARWVLVATVTCGLIFVLRRSPCYPSAAG